MSARKILITGGCGFLGANLAAGAAVQGREIFLFDNLSRESSVLNLQWITATCREVRFSSGDVRDRDAVLAAVRDFAPDCIFHCAGQVAMTHSLADPRLDFETNALGTLNVLEAIRACRVDPVLVYSSTNKVYGDLEHIAIEETPTRYVLAGLPRGLPESLPLDFRTPYGVSKGSADQMVLDAFRSFGVRSTVFRHSSMYGARQFATQDQGWIGWFCAQALEQAHRPAHRFTVSGSGKQVRDLLHADDMLALYLYAADHPVAVAGEAFNVGGGPQNALSILELLACLGETLGVDLAWERIDARRSDQKVFIADIAKIHDRTGWAPAVDCRTGLDRMLTWADQVRSANH